MFGVPIRAEKQVILATQYVNRTMTHLNFTSFRKVTMHLHLTEDAALGRVPYQHHFCYNLSGWPLCMLIILYIYIYIYVSLPCDIHVLYWFHKWTPCALPVSCDSLPAKPGVKWYIMQNVQHTHIAPGLQVTNWHVPARHSELWM
jgi:hypothetical protein